EDGIRDFHVTGVQTCALPIYNVPIAITNNNAIVSYIFYEDSLLITRLTYYPYILILISLSLLILTYYAFRSSQKYEQNQVWVGRSEERRVGKERRVSILKDID